MTRKHAEMERELIADLEARTGRSLAAWMDVIDQAGLVEKNAIIDWLRPQGFTFAHASWLERIHNNGGRPVYLSAAQVWSERRPVVGAPVAARVVAPPSPSVPKPVVSLPPVPPLPPLAPAPAVSPTADGRAGSDAAVRPAVPVSTARASSPSAALATEGDVATGEGGVAGLLARGKAYRPLAELLLREVRGAVPGVAIEARGEVIVLANPEPFGAVLPGPKDVRLALALGAGAGLDGFVRGRLPGAPEGLGAVAVLTDARKIGGDLMDAVRRADALVNGQGRPDVTNTDSPEF